MPQQPLASQRLHAIADRLKVTGQRGTRLEMTRALRAGAKPLVTAVRQSARERLPRAGGLNEWEATQPISVNVLTGAHTAGVRIRTRTKGSVQTDSGYVRHPVFGSGDSFRALWQWETQQIPQAEGWWTDPLRKGSPAVTPLLIAELNRIARKINGF